MASTKSGCKRLFAELQIPTAPGAFEIYDEKELINTLAVLITNNPAVPTWLLKIDDESQGRGIAFLHVRKLGLRDLNQSPEAVFVVAQVLQQKLPFKLQVVYTTLFRSYAEYMSAFTRRGGIIEASPNVPFSSIESPSLFFRVEPDGRVEVLGTFDKLRVNDYVPIACVGPKRALPNINVQLLCANVGERLHKKGLFGYMQLDLIAWGQGFWAVGLDCFLSTMSASCLYFDFLMRGKIDQLTGAYSVDLSVSALDAQPKRAFLYCPLIINEGLEGLQYKTFFQLCRLESISFNLEKKCGSTFVLIDSLQSGALSVMTIGTHYHAIAPPQGTASTPC